MIEHRDPSQQIFYILLPPGDLNASFRTLANPPPRAPQIAGPFVDTAKVESLKHRKLQLRDENQKSTILRIRGLLWTFPNGIAHVCSYSQSLDQFGFALVVRKLNSIHIRKGTSVPFLIHVRMDIIYIYGAL